MPEVQEQTQPFSTGFEELAQSQPSASPASAEPEQIAKPTPSPVEEAPVSQSAESINLVAEGPPATSETARLNQQLYDRIMAARNAPPAVPAVQPPIPFVTEQTKREMAAGAHMNTHYEKIKNLPRAIRRVDTPNDSNSPVFRPADYVPNFNQGNAPGSKPIV